MPAKRVPWLKFWPEAVDHPKIAELADGERWTWIKLLAKASQQAQRGRFATVRHAAEVVGRPAAHVKRLIAVGLLDDTADGLVMHDWDEWQRWRPGDTNDEPTPTDDPPKTTRTTTEQLPNTALKKGEGRREKGERENDESHDSSLSARADGPDVEREIYDYFKTRIAPLSRTFPRKRIATRLKKFSADELRQGIDHFAADAWWMEHNASRGADWFFDNDARAEQFLLLKPRPKVVPINGKVAADDAAQLEKWGHLVG